MSIDLSSLHRPVQTVGPAAATSVTLLKRRRILDGEAGLPQRVKKRRASCAWALRLPDRNDAPLGDFAYWSLPERASVQT